MGWTSRDFECSECHDTFSAIVEVLSGDPRMTEGTPYSEPCAKCGSVVRCVMAPTCTTPTLVVGSEAFDNAVEKRARDHDKRISHPQYFESRGEPVPRRFR